MQDAIRVRHDHHPVSNPTEAIRFQKHRTLGLSDQKKEKRGPKRSVDSDLPIQQQPITAADKNAAVFILAEEYEERS